MPDANDAGADVLILGAGAAGLAAAHELAARGVGALVLEPRDRVGGRIHMVCDPASGVPIERGAEFVHGRPEATWRFIRDAKRGAYSYVRVGGDSARKQLARPIEQTLFFAGEATDTAGEAGTVAGALASGRRAAREVLRSL